MYILDTDHLSLIQRNGQERLRKTYPRVGSMDLKIAAIALTNKAILLTRNVADFGQIVELQTEDWTTA